MPEIFASAYSSNFPDAMESFHNFIDGTVEGTDLSGYSYPNFLQDYTYYGNGCPNDWGDGGDGGSQQSCTTRIAQTADHEDMKNGTYYNRNGATAGSTLTTAGNTDAPDTFCPLGWQVPYGGTGGDYYDKSRSWRYLFQSYSFVPETPPYGNDVREYPISLIASGNYRWGDGRLYSASFDGDYQASTVREQYYNYQFDVGGTTFHVERSTGKSFGQAIRCVTRY